MKKLKIFMLFLFGIAQGAISQTATGTFTQVPCNNDGIFTVTTTGLSLPITYTYYTNAGVITHSNVNATTDQLTNIGMSNYGYVYCQVTDGISTEFAQDSYTPAFSFALNGTSPLCPATMGTVEATQTGGTPGPFTFDWTNSQTLTSYQGNNISVPEGEYSVEITDQTTGCVLVVADTALSIQQYSNISATINTTEANCTNGTAEAVLPTGGVAPYTYLWANGATTSSITGLSQGSHTVEITDNQGCVSSTLYGYVEQNPQITVNTTVTNATCIQSDGEAMAFGAGGTNPYTYEWSNGQTGNTATNLTGASYSTVIATDANGCIGTGYAYINMSTPITVSYNATASQCTAPTGSATLTPSGGTAPYTYFWNSSPSTTSATLSNVAPGTYSFKVTDAVGCIRTGSVVVNPVSSINASIQGSTVVCPNVDGSAVVNVSGSSPPFTYLWSNGATSNQINNVPPGSYSCEITDANSCVVTKTGWVSEVSPLIVTVSTVPTSCIFETDGAANTTVFGGQPPYTYSYSNGTTSANATNLGTGNYSLVVTDANGCSTWKHFVITNSNTSTSCYCTIEGNVYVDGNANCTYESGELGIENIMIHCAGFGYTFTDASGYYSFQVPSGTYTISEQINAYYPLAACQSNSTSVTVTAAAGCNSVVDIANDMSTISDLKIVTVNAHIPPVPGNNYQQKVIIQNMGTVTESGIQLGYEHDGQLPFVSSTSTNFLSINNPLYPHNYGIDAGFPSLSPNATDVMLLNYDTPTSIPIGTNVEFHDTVTNLAPIDVNWLLDYSPWNNVKHHQTSVVASYDPNYKEVSPKGLGDPGYISSTTKEFDYTVHFQNEGTYFAQNIYITDQLDDDLDWSTLKPGYSDYDYTTTVSETGLITFTFANINLPWKSGYGDALSSGLINYSIQRKASTPQGTEFTNFANIYFDYNAPITTNTTVNTLNDELASVDEPGDDAALTDLVSVDLFPVPANDLLTVRVNNVSKNESVTFSIIDIMGNVVLSNGIDLNEGSTSSVQDVSRLATGTYLTRIQFEDGSTLIKRIVIR